MIEQLMRAGLTHNEASVYLTCLRMGRAPAAQIAERSGLPRTTAYDVLGKLDNMRLISGCKVNDRMHFSPNDPKRLMTSLERQKDAIKQLLPELHQLRGKLQTQTTADTYGGDRTIRKPLDNLMASPGDWLVLGSLPPAQHPIKPPPILS